MPKRFLVLIVAGAILIAFVGVHFVRPAQAAALPSNGGDPTVTGPTFNKDIAPILFQNCATCHHPGEVAPFSLLTYADAAKKAGLLAMVTEKRVMPPWKAEPGYGS